MDEAMIRLAILWWFALAVYLLLRARRLWRESPYGWKRVSYWVATVGSDVLMDKVVVRRKGDATKLSLGDFLHAKVRDPFFFCFFHSLYWGGGMYWGLTRL